MESIEKVTSKKIFDYNPPDFRLYKSHYPDPPSLATNCHTQKIEKEANSAQIYKELTLLVDDESKICWTSKQQIQKMISWNFDYFFKKPLGCSGLFFYKNKEGNLLSLRCFVDWESGKKALLMEWPNNSPVWPSSCKMEVIVPCSTSSLISIIDI